MGSFGNFGDFPVKTVCQTGLSGHASQQRKYYTPSVVISEVLPRVNLGPGHAGSAKLTLGVTSEMTPRRQVYRFLRWLALPGRPVGHTVFTGNAKNPQKAPKMGVTPPQIRATLLLLFTINLAQKRCLYLALPLLGPKKSAPKRCLY